MLVTFENYKRTMYTYEVGSHIEWWEPIPDHVKAIFRVDGLRLQRVDRERDVFMYQNGATVVQPHWGVNHPHEFPLTVVDVYKESDKK